MLDRRLADQRVLSQLEDQTCTSLPRHPFATLCLPAPAASLPPPAIVLVRKIVQNIDHGGRYGVAFEVVAGPHDVLFNRQKAGRRMRNGDFSNARAWLERILRVIR